VVGNLGIPCKIWRQNNLRINTRALSIAQLQKTKKILEGNNMQFKKLVAVAGSALMAGMALATPALAATTVAEISSVPALEDGVPTYKVVFGAGAAAEDVAAGANLASWAASLTGAEKTIDSTTSSTVTGGVELATPAAKLYYGSSINAARSTLTSTEMPGVLDSGVVKGTTGTEYKFDLILNIGSTAAIAYGKSGTSLTEPAPHVNLGSTSTTNYFYQMDIVFTKALNFSAADADNKKIILFGKEYTIGSGAETSATKMVLYGKGEEEVIKWAGDSVTKTVTIGDTEVEVVLNGVTSGSGADLEINGVSYTNQTTGTYLAVGGTTVYVKSVSYYGTNNGGVVLRFGADKITLESGEAVRTGSENTEVTGTLCTFTASSSEISKIEVAVAKENAANDLIVSGEEWIDPVFGSLTFKFDGLNPAIGVATRETIELAAASDYVATLSFVDRTGVEASIDVATNYYSDSGQTTNLMADGNLYNYTVVENATVSINDYVVLNQAGMSYLLQFTSTSLTSTPYTITMYDVIAKSSLSPVTFSSGANGGTATTGNIIGGKTYTIMLASNTSEAETIRFAWNSAGTTTVYPTLKTSNGANIALMKPINLTVTASDTGSTIVVLPSGTDNTAPTQTSTVYFNSSANGTAAGAGIVNVTTGTSSDAATPFTVGNQTYVMRLVGAAGTALEIRPSQSETPTVYIREEKAKDGSSEVYEGIVLPITVETGSPNKVAVDAADPTFTGTASSFATITGNTVSKAMDIYGTLVTKDTTGQGVITVSYPDNQATAELFVLTEEGVVDSAASGDTYREQVEITADVAMVDTEVTAADKANFDMFVIGGPCVNKIAADLLELDGYTCGEDSKIPEGKGVVQVFESGLGEGKVAVLVAGWEKAETNLAARAIQTGALEDQTGMEVTISGTSVDALTIE
jgi:hypothetical protein